MVQRFSFEAFGVPLAVEIGGSATPSLVGAVRAILPPGRVPLVPPSRTIATLAITARGGAFLVRGIDHSDRTHAVQREAVHALDAELRSILALVAPDHVFIHAGVVRGADGAIVVPGRSMSGKTTLVAALVRAGASYLSDEYAVLEPNGLVWPYPRSLSFRDPDGGRTDVAPSVLGRQAPHQGVSVKLVVTSTYRPGATWHPNERTAAEGALALIDNAVAARVRPAEVLAAATAVARSSRHLSGDRGDAETVAHALLTLVGGPAPALAPVPTTLVIRGPAPHLGIVRNGDRHRDN